MHRLTLGFVLAALLTLVSVVAVGAQLTTAEEESRTTQIPGTDVAVTLPTDWRIWVSPDPERDAVVASQLRARQSCSLRPVEGATSAEAAAEDLLSTLARHDPTIIKQRSFEAPVGEAVYVAYRYGAAPDEPRGEPLCPVAVGAEA